MPKIAPTKKVQSSAVLARQKKHRAMFKRLLNFDGKHSLDPETLTKAKHLIGTDEVGRGCLAGPVVAAAVILPEIKPGTTIGKSLIELNDSKKLSFAQREKLALILQDISTWAIGEASPEEINQINILHASLLAMRRAIEKIESQVDLRDMPVLVLIDGNKKVKDIVHEQRPVVDGDAKSASIAAASIIAKVHRDRFMMQLSKSFPSYNWHQNKGYGSKVHRDALKSEGMTEWHRRVFCEKFMVEQLTIELSNGDENEDSEDDGVFDIDEAFKELVSG
jgi:ribonuclease HII